MAAVLCALGTTWVAGVAPASAVRPRPPATTTTTTGPTTTTTVAGATTTTGAAGTSVHFATLPPGATLPSDATCAALVRRSPDEPRPDNAAANAAIPPPGSFTLTALDNQVGYDNRTPALEARVTGNFTGTTDEIIQWAACKWGFDEDEVRAIAATESWWHMSQLGDVTTNQALCPPGLIAPCPRSFGIHQVTWSSDPVGTYPWSQRSTAFNLDASLLVHRVCFEGYTTWLRNIGYTSYAAGDEWGCVGQWYSGNWHDVGAQTYIAKVQGYMATKPWTQPGFADSATTATTVPTATTTTAVAPVTTTTAPTLATTTTTVAPTTTTVPACPCLRYGFEDGTTQGWYVGWGPMSLANTTSPVNTGTRALAMTLTPTGANWPAVQLSSPAGLTSGMAVTYWVYQPAAGVLTSVQPYVADLNWNDVMAPARTLAAGWNQVTWTVPAVSGIKGIGLVLNDDSGWNGTVVLDSVSW